MKQFILVATIAAALCAVASAADSPTAPSNGSPLRVDRPWLGVVFAEGLTWEMKPVLIAAAVVADAPANKAGIDDGDLLVRIGGARAETIQVVNDLLDKAHAGDQPDVHFIHDGVPHIGKITLELPTETQIAFLERLAASDDVRADVLKSAFIPRQLCIGLTWGEAFALSLAPQGFLVLPLDQAESCRHPAPMCSLLALVKQTESKTVVARRGLKYSLKGDWRSVTFDNRDDCLKAAADEQDF